MIGIVNGKIWHENRFIEDAALLFHEEVVAILPPSHLDDQVEQIDAGGSYVLPGFIDVHIHGYGGHDVMDGKLDGLNAISKSLCSNGVTAYLPTTMTSPEVAIRQALDTIRQAQTSSTQGAMVIGGHLEGPFINPAKKGAQPEASIQLPKPDLIEAYSDILKVVTIAPEMPGALDLIRSYQDKINFSLGHSTATFDEAKQALELGATSFTHLFNAMTGLHHRDPGMVGAALTSDCYCEVIADKLHINPKVFSMLAKTKGMEQLLLITDCIRAGGLGDGNYELGGQGVTLKNGFCTLADGTLAGSALKLQDGLKNFYEAIPNALAEVIPLVTINPATYLGVHDKMGSLDKGKLANITIMDQNFNIQKTFVKGKQVYENHL